MARGGSRPGAGRPPLTDAEKAQRAEARNEKRRAARKLAKPKAKAKKKALAAPAGFSPDGAKAADAPTQWPFGTSPEQPKDPEPPVVDPDADPVINADTPLELLLGVVKERRLKLALRMQAAALAAPFVHAKPAPIGKKEAAAEAAKQTGKASKFGAIAAPKLAAVNGRTT